MQTCAWCRTSGGTGWYSENCGAVLSPRSPTPDSSPICGRRCAAPHSPRSVRRVLDPGRRRCSSTAWRDHPDRHRAERVRLDARHRCRARRRLVVFALLESSSWQATLGKKTLGLAVVNTRRHAADFGARASATSPRSSRDHALHRLHDGRFTRQKRALHDMIAETLVVSGRRARGSALVFTDAG